MQGNRNTVQYNSFIKYLPWVDFVAGLLRTHGRIAAQHVVQCVSHTFDGRIHTESGPLQQCVLHQAHVVWGDVPARWAWVAHGGDVCAGLQGGLAEPLLLDLGEESPKVGVQQGQRVARVGKGQDGAHGVDVGEHGDAFVQPPGGAAYPHQCHVLADHLNRLTRGGGSPSNPNDSFPGIKCADDL